jgi:hypothetical protein
MFYTGIDPATGKEVYVARDYNEKQMQRALLQFARPANAPLVRKALRLAGREDLIGHNKDCLVRPEPPKQYSKPDNKKNVGNKKPTPKKRNDKPKSNSNNKPQRGKKR